MLKRLQYIPFRGAHTFGQKFVIGVMESVLSHNKTSYKPDHSLRKHEHDVFSPPSSAVPQVTMRRPLTRSGNLSLPVSPCPRLSLSQQPISFCGSVWNCAEVLCQGIRSTFEKSCFSQLSICWCFFLLLPLLLPHSIFFGGAAEPLFLFCFVFSEQIKSPSGAALMNY